MTREQSPIKKVFGLEQEIPCFMTGTAPGIENRRQAATEILRRMPGLASRNNARGGGTDRDWGRKFSAEGGDCCYIDMGFLECVLRETAAAREGIAGVRGIWHRVREAIAQANADLDPREVRAYLRSSDGEFSSGWHVNLSLTRPAWESLMHLEALLPVQFILAHLVSGIAVWGQGLVRNGNFLVSMRAPFIERIVGEDTIARRGLLNTRFESHTGLNSSIARWHLISVGDPPLQQVSQYIQWGSLQILGCMLETGGRVFRGNAILENPLEALHAYNSDPSLRTRARLMTGEELTAPELGLRICDQASGFVESGACDGLVPDAADIVKKWRETLEMLLASDWASLARRIDWVLKYSLIDEALERRDLDWNAPEAQVLDHLYSSLDPDEGLLWQYEKNGFTESVIDQTSVSHFAKDPPKDTRAYGRVMLLRRAEAEGIEVEEVDWDRITFKIRRGNGLWFTRQTVWMPDPAGHDLETVAPLLESQCNLASLLEDLSTPGGGSAISVN